MRVAIGRQRRHIMSDSRQQQQDHDAALARLDRGFMRPEIDGPVDVWEVSYDHGSTAWIPCDAVGSEHEHLADYVEGTVDRDDEGQIIAERRTGVWIARLSAPGYMDCTEWSVHDSLRAAEGYLVELYDDGELDA